VCVSEEIFVGFWNHGYHICLVIRRISLMCVWPVLVVTDVHCEAVSSR